MPVPVLPASQRATFGVDKALIQGMERFMVLPNACREWFEMAGQSPIGGYPLRVKRPPRS
jgi:hypothetical protein